MFKLFYPEETSKVKENFFVVKSFFSNVFVFTEGDHSFCIDAGYSPGSLNAGFKNLDIKPESINAVFLTHSDFDHVGGLPLFPNAKIYMNKKEEEMTKRIKSRSFGLTYNKDIFRPPLLISNNEIIEIGSHKIQAFSTPGHTPGHTVYLVDNTYLFTGDSIIIRKGSFHPLFCIFNNKHKDAVASVEIVKSIKGVKYICTTHFGIHKAHELN